MDSDACAFADDRIVSEDYRSSRLIDGFESEITVRFATLLRSVQASVSNGRGIERSNGILIRLPVDYTTIISD